MVRAVAHPGPDAEDLFESQGDGARVCLLAFASHQAIGWHQITISLSSRPAEEAA
jgi:hypothetical protein